MILRIVTSMALLAGTALVCLPAQAQTGTTAQSTVNSGGASPTGSVGTTSNTPRDNSSSSSTTMGQSGGGTTNSPGMSGHTTTTGKTAHGSRYQAQARSTAGMRGGNTAERQITDCLNNAAAQNQPLDSCKR